MLTPQEEYEYYLSQAKTSEVLGLKDSDYKIVAERFHSIAERCKKKIILVSTPLSDDNPIYQQFNKGQQK